MAALLLVLLWIFVRWNLANVVALQLDPKSPDSRFIADWLTEFSPSDPRTHLLAAKVYESSFDANDLDRAVREYEFAASLSPHNYVMWLNLGRVRGLVGDADGAFKAFERALELAPNYSLVKWVYGNAFIREGRTDEGFNLISSAAASDPKYVRPAVLTAIQIFDGSVDEVRRSMGDTAAINAGLAETLVSLDRPEEALDAWRRLSPEMMTGQFHDLGQKLQSKLIDLKRYRMASVVHAGITTNKLSSVSEIVNGGFEEGVRLGSTNVFDWRISDGTHPQVGLSDGAKRSGQYSLLLAFNSFDTAGMRVIDQVIAVEPATDYELEVFYRSDLRSDAVLKWEISDASSSQRIAVSPITNAAEWTPLKLLFRSPETSDGIQLRLIREGCSGPACPMSGRLLFDDISLRQL